MLIFDLNNHDYITGFFKVYVACILFLTKERDFLEFAIVSILNQSHLFFLE